MTAIVASSFANLEDVTTEQLRVELARALEVTAENLLWLARLWRELERRGEDLRELRSGIRTFLPLIADGRLDAQTAVQFAGNVIMLRALATLPIKEQKRIAAGGKIDVVMIRDKQPVTRAMRGDDMSVKMIRQVFAAGRTRSEEEQRALLTMLNPSEPHISVRSEMTSVRLNKDKVAIWRRLAERRNQTIGDLIASALDPIIQAEMTAEAARRAEKNI